MGLLHLTWSKILLILLIFFIDVAEQLKNSVSNAKTSLINILFTNTFCVYIGSLELKLAGVSVGFAVNTVQLVGYYSYVYLVFH